MDGHHDVGEQDGGIDAVAPDRLEGELGRERRIGDGREDGAFPAGGAVLGQRPPGLAHEPHGRTGHRSTQARLNEAELRLARRGVHPSGSTTTAVP